MSYIYNNHYTPVNTNYNMQYYSSQPFKMNYLQTPNDIKFKTPSGVGHIPFGVNAQINFYDPVTGRPGPVVNTLPQMQQMINRPNGYNVNITGNVSDVEKINYLIKNNGEIKFTNNKKILDPTDENLKKLEEEINERNKYKQNIDNYQFNNRVSITGDYRDVTKINRIIHGNYIQDNNNDQNIIDENKIYYPSDDNLQKLSKEINQRNNENKSSPVNLYQNIFPNSNWKLHGDLLVHPSLSSTYTGSGILLFEKYNNLYSNLTHTVILAQEANGNFGDFGGMIDIFQPNSIENTLAFNAQNKISEESNGTFIVNSYLYNFPKIDVTNANDSTIYRCFLVGIDGDILKLNNQDLSNLFNTNYKSFKGSKKIQKISRFNLNQLFKDIKNTNNENVITQDTNNIQATLSDRVVQILKKMLNHPSFMNSVFTDLYESKLVRNSNGAQSILV